MSDITTKPTDPPGDADLKWLNRLADVIDERFDSVLILVTKRDITKTGSTAHFSIGRGNYYARMGQVREYLVKEDEISRVEARGEDDE